VGSMSARRTATSSGKRASASRSAGTTRASRATGAGRSLSAAFGGLKKELLKPGKRRAMLAGAAFAACMMLLFASIAVWSGLSHVMDQGWAALIVTAVWAIVCAVLYAASNRPAASRPSSV
jgi:putative superfamily III holin-X